MEEGQKKGRKRSRQTNEKETKRRLQVLVLRIIKTKFQLALAKPLQKRGKGCSSRVSMRYVCLSVSITLMKLSINKTRFFFFEHVCMLLEISQPPRKGNRTNGA